MASNEGSLALSNLPGVCQHPLGLSAAEMSTLDQGGGIMFGSIAISRSVAAPELLSLGFDSYEGASAQFGTQDAWSIFALAQPQPPDELYYTCQVPGSPVSYFAPDGRNATGDAGTSLTLTGPSGTRLDLRKIGSNFLVPSADGQCIGPIEMRFLQSAERPARRSPGTPKATERMT
jgi:hypothetical protein